MRAGLLRACHLSGAPEILSFEDKEKPPEPAGALARAAPADWGGTTLVDTRSGKIAAAR